MSYTNLFTKVSLSGLALALSACGTIDGRTSGRSLQKITDVEAMSKPAQVRDPCNSVGIEAVPNTQVTKLEIAQNLQAGRRVQKHLGWTIFSDEPLTVKFAPLVGGLLGGVAGNAVGGGIVNVFATGAGASAGALAGERVAKNDRIEYLTDLAACRAYLNDINAEYREFISNQPADRPHGAPARVFDNNSQYEVQIAPYSATSPGGSRDPNLRVVPRGRCFGC